MKKLSMPELDRISVEEFKQQQKHPVVLVLDNLRSMHNIGAAFRTSDAFLVEAVVLCGITAQPPHREIHKTALGATESVFWRYEAETARAIAQLKAEGYKIVVIEQTDKAQMLHHYAFDAHQKYAFVFGNEVEGVSEEALALAHDSVEIPQFGTKHSLNVSVSIGIVLWQYLASTRL